MTNTSTVCRACCSLKKYYSLWILVDFTYPSLEESVPSKPAQMPPPPAEVDENTELRHDQGGLNTSVPAEPVTASKADGSPTIQPLPIIKNVPQVLSCV